MTALFAIVRISLLRAADAFSRDGQETSGSGRGNGAGMEFPEAAEPHRPAEKIGSCSTRPRVLCRRGR